MNAKEKQILRDNPCTPDCPRRRAGCAIDCPERAAFVEGRQQIYAERAKNAQRGFKTAGHTASDRKRAKDKQRHHKSMRY